MLGRLECDISCFIHVICKFLFFLSWTIPFLLSLFLLLFLKNEKEGSRVEDGTG